MSFFHSTGYRLKDKIVLNMSKKQLESGSTPYFSISLEILSKDVALLFLRLFGEQGGEMTEPLIRVYWISITLFGFIKTAIF